MAVKVVGKIAPDFLRGVWGPACKGELGMIFAPGRYKPNQPQRSLLQDLTTLKQAYNTKTLVSLIQPHEYQTLRITDKANLCQKLQIKHLQFPIADYGVPDNRDGFKEFVRKVVDEEIRRDKVVVVHCKAGLGRTGLFAGSCLVYGGVQAGEAVDLVRRTRPGTLETEEQVNYVKSLRF